VFNSDAEVNIDMDWLINNSSSVLGLLALFIAAFISLSIFAILWIGIDHMFGDPYIESKEALKNIKQLRKEIENQKIIRGKSNEL
jgi:hypothetical protein